MNWIGYTPYEQFMQAVSKTNPALAAQQSQSEQTFNVTPATVPYMNTPQHARSTFIRQMRYLPTSNTVFVTLGNSQYWYPCSQRMLAQWLTSNSLGRYYNHHVKVR